MAQTAQTVPAKLLSGSDPKTSYVTGYWERKVGLFLAKRAEFLPEQPDTPGQGQTVQAQLASDTVDGLDLSQFRIRFQTQQADTGAQPMTAWIRVYNINLAHVKDVIKEYASVSLNAGYDPLNGGKYGVIFQGTIKQYKYGHETAVDSFLDIYAADGDVANNFAVTNTHLPAGWDLPKWINAHKDALKKYGGLREGYDGLKKKEATIRGMTRGMTIYDMAPDGLTQATGYAGATWYSERGKIIIMPMTGYLPGEAVTLTGRTGLIGWPEQTEGGITARCLLNPAIKVAGLVHIDNDSINRVAPVYNSRGGYGDPLSRPDAVRVGEGPDTLGPETGYVVSHFPTFANQHMWAPVAEDGFYRVLVVEHVGDSRGNDWYSNLNLLAADISAVAAVEGEQPDAVDELDVSEGTDDYLNSDWPLAR